VLFSAVAAFAQQPVTAPAGPVPQAIIAAKKIFVSNTGPTALDFSGGPNRAYNQLCAGLKATGRFKMVGDPSDADLVLELQIVERSPSADFKLIIYDRKTHFILWALPAWISPANLQKNRDSNFDDALSAVLHDFEALTGKAPAADH
jgi:hypothetical protein